VEDKLLDLLLGNVPSTTRDVYRKLLREGKLDGHTVKLWKKESSSEQSNPFNFQSNNEQNQPQQIFKVFLRNVNAKQEEHFTAMTIQDAREYLLEQETEQISTDSIIDVAIKNVEQNGIVFIDEIDKICMPRESKRNMGDASADGVQRDLLPLVEGCVVSTNHGDVDTSKILFVASGAFYNCKPSDLLPELQGRFPVRVDLKGLGKQDLKRILLEPEYNLLKQQIELLKTEGVNLSFSPEAIDTIATMAARVNETIENIGARRLQTIVEKITEDISCNCADYQGDIIIDAKKVNDCVAPMLEAQDLSQYII